jgi:hypothetical protein
MALVLVLALVLVSVLVLVLVAYHHHTKCHHTDRKSPRLSSIHQMGCKRWEQSHSLHSSIALHQMVWGLVLVLV